MELVIDRPSNVFFANDHFPMDLKTMENVQIRVFPPESESERAKTVVIELFGLGADPICFVQLNKSQAAYLANFLLTFANE